MTATATTIIKLKQLYPKLKGNNRRIADHLLKSPELLMSQKVCDIAESCSCPSSQVIRFCQRLGFKGFKELKAHLAQELIPLRAETHYEELESSDVFGRLRADYCRNVEQALNDTLANLDGAQVLEAVKRIHDARRIVVCGIGASAMTAQDFHEKLARAGLNSTWAPDAAMQKIVCSVLEKSDLLIVFSFSGSTAAMLDCMKLVKENGGTRLLITNYPDSPAAGLADLTLLTVAGEDKFRLGAMTSRLTQLAIIDMVLLQLALTYPDEVNRNAMRTYHALQPK